ncbi:MAG: hypothetical protein M3132_15110 [Actinomycetia bacterium]|nr:hypothetical protein [Actinomycetes bacterium]
MIDSFDLIKLADAAPSGSEPPGSVLTFETLLVDIDERAGYMPIDTQVPDTTPNQTKKTRRGWFTAAVAFGVVLLLGAMTILIMNETGDVPPADDDVTTTEAATTTVTLSAELQVTYDTALRTIDVFNNGDIDSWMKMFRQDGAFWGLQMSGTHIREFVEFRMASGEQLVVDTCVPHTDGRRIACTVTIVNDLFTAAGLPTHVAEWIVGSDEKGRVLDIMQESDLGGDEIEDLIAALGLWIRDTYPDIWQEVFVAAGDCSLDQDSPNCVNGEWYGTPETSRELLRFVDEFVAQSDVYPLNR